MRDKKNLYVSTFGSDCADQTRWRGFMAFDMDALPGDVKVLIASYTAVTPLQEMATCVCNTDPVYYTPEFMENEPLPASFPGIRCEDGNVALAYDLDTLPCTGRVEDADDEEDEVTRQPADHGHRAVRDLTGRHLCVYECYDYGHSAAVFGEVATRTHATKSVLARTCKFFRDAPMPRVVTNCVLPAVQWVGGIQSGSQECEGAWKVVVVPTCAVQAVKDLWECRDEDYE